MRYYGGKGKLVEKICEVVHTHAPLATTVGDLFAGTGVVGSGLRARGTIVVANDILHSCYCLNIANLAFKTADAFHGVGGLHQAVEKLNAAQPAHSFVSEHFSPAGAAGRQYFSSVNAGKIDSMRTQIEEWGSSKSISELESAALIGLLLKAINRVSNVTGTYAAFLKNWDARALRPIQLIVDELCIEGPKGRVLNSDTFAISSSELPAVAYIDPPYNNRDYASNYHVLEQISVGWFQNPQVPKGLTGVVTDNSKKSLFSSRRTVHSAFEELLRLEPIRTMIISYNNEGLISIAHLVELLSEHGTVTNYEIEHKRFRSINQDGGKPVTQEHLLVLERK